MPGIPRTNSNPEPLTEAVELLRKVARENIDAFIQQQFVVTDFQGKEVPFKYRHGQRVIAETLAKLEKSGKPARVYVLKSRQIGLTTMTANRNFVKILCNNNRRAVTVAHLEGRAKEILGKLKFAYSKLPAFLRFALSQDSKSELGFADFNSKMFICSAATIGAIELARGDTLQDVHFSEFTRYKDAEHALFELLQVCHAVAGNSFVIETTGKRYGSYAHRYWEASVAGQTPFVAKFLPWQEDPDCDLDKGTWTDEERDRNMREVWEYEPMLIERAELFGIKPGHTYWAYLRLRNECLGNWEKFLEDYPCTPEEAWRSKGELYFDSNNIIKLLKKCEVVPVVSFRLSLSNLEDGFKNFGDLQQTDEIDIHSDEPYIQVWRPPQGDRRYVVSGDSGGGGEQGDPSSTFVIDMYTGEMMAEFHGLVKPHQHAKVMSSLCRIYSMGYPALAAPEVNSMGMATLQDLQREWPNIYVWKHLDDNKNKPTNKLGWYTGMKSRALMLALLERVVNETADGNVMADGAIRSLGFVAEMNTFVDEDGKPEAAAGFHDDRIMALAIAWYVAQMETRGRNRNEDILSVLRPREIQESDSGLSLVSGMNVEDAISAVRKKLRLEEYGNHG